MLVLQEMAMADEGQFTLVLSHSAVCHLGDMAEFDMNNGLVISSAEEVLLGDVT